MIKVQDTAFAEYSVPDLDKMEAFLTDFGLVRAARTDDRLYMRGAGTRPYLHVSHKGDPGFVACAMEAGSKDDLETIAGHKDAITGIEHLDGPGGGHCVSLKMPNGITIRVVHGIEPAEDLPVRAPLAINFGKEKHRTGVTQRPEIEPAKVMRVGHCVFKCTDEAANRAWLKETLGMLESDVLHVPDDETTRLGTFMRCDRGDGWADHHSIFVISDEKDNKIHHLSFETQDPDAVFIGHQWLIDKAKWHHEWGVGRHLLGSQVFDYWRDPWGHIVEHYADGDLLNASSKPGLYPATQENLAQWGPELTPTFFD
jgi:catechol 2,3-dioxygenase-like lactoylglutathione lyase family enzyme